MYNEQRKLMLQLKRCVLCKKGRGADGTKVLCRACADLMKERQKERHEARRWSGRCLRCGAELPDQYIYCPTCRANAVERQNKHKASVTLGI
jgi:hypothetical protein